MIFTSALLSLLLMIDSVAAEINLIAPAPNTTDSSNSTAQMSVIAPTPNITDISSNGTAWAWGANGFNQGRPQIGYQPGFGHQPRMPGGNQQMASLEQFQQLANNNQPQSEGSFLPAAFQQAAAANISSDNRPSWQPGVNFTNNGNFGRHGTGYRPRTQNSTNNATGNYTVHWQRGMNFTNGTSFHNGTAWSMWHNGTFNGTINWRNGSRLYWQNSTNWPNNNGTSFNGTSWALRHNFTNINSSNGVLLNNGTQMTNQTGRHHGQQQQGRIQQMSGGALQTSNGVILQPRDQMQGSQRGQFGDLVPSGQQVFGFSSNGVQGSNGGMGFIQQQNSSAPTSN